MEQNNKYLFTSDTIVNAMLHNSVMKPFVKNLFILLIFGLIYIANSCLEIQKYPTFRWSDWRPILWDDRYEYKYPNGHLTWDDARKKCWNESAELLTIETEDEWRGLRRLITHSEARTAFTPVYFSLWVNIWRKPQNVLWFIDDVRMFDDAKSPVKWWSPRHEISDKSDMVPDQMRCVYLVMFNTEQRRELGYINENCSRLHPWVCKRRRS